MVFQRYKSWIVSSVAVVDAMMVDAMVDTMVDAMVDTMVDASVRNTMVGQKNGTTLS